MQRMWLAGMALAGLVLASGVRGAADNGVNELKGTWTLVSGEKAGHKAEEKEVNAIAVVIDDITFTFTRGDKREEMKVSVESKVTPKEITLTTADGTVWPGIYEFDGDVLRLCLSGTDARPKEFAAPKGSRTALMNWKRKKD